MVLNNLALLLQATNRLSEAEPLFRGRWRSTSNRRPRPPRRRHASTTWRSCSGHQPLAEAEPLYRGRWRSTSDRTAPTTPTSPSPQQPGGVAPGHEPPGGGRAALSPRAGDRREVVRPRPPRRRHPTSTTWRGCSRPPTACRRPSRSIAARWRSTRNRTAPTTPTSRSASTTWRCCSRPPTGCRRPSRSIAAPWRSTRSRTAPTTPTSRSTSTTWRSCSRPRTGCRRPSRSIAAPWRSTSGRTAPTTPTSRPPQQPGGVAPGHEPPGRRPSRSIAARWRSTRDRTAPTTPTSRRDLNNLAVLLQATNRLAEAEPLYRRALAIDERSYGPDHPDVAIRPQQPGGVAPGHEPAGGGRAADGTRRSHPLAIPAIDRPRTPAPANRCRELPPTAHRRSSSPSPRSPARIKAAREGTDKLSPIVPEVERLLGPAKPVADVLTSLDRQYKEQGKPAVYFLKPDEPIAPHLDELLRPNGDGLNAQGVPAFRRGAHADAIVLYEAALELMADQPAQAPAKLRTRMNRAAALRELGLVAQARDELVKLLPELDQLPATDSTTKGRARYHLALCQWRLGDRAAAQTVGGGVARRLRRRAESEAGRSRHPPAVRGTARGPEGWQGPAAARRDRRTGRARGRPRPLSSPRGADQAPPEGEGGSLAGPDPRPGQVHPGGLRRRSTATTASKGSPRSGSCRSTSRSPRTSINSSGRPRPSRRCSTPSTGSTVPRASPRSGSCRSTSRSAPHLDELLGKLPHGRPDAGHSAGRKA